MPGRPLIRPRMGRQIAGVCLALAQGQWLGCRGGPHYRRARLLLFQRPGRRGLCGRLDRNSRGGAAFAGAYPPGSVSSGYMNGAYLFDGASLGFSDAGSGLPVVFLHPTPLDRDYLASPLRRAGRRARHRSRPARPRLFRARRCAAGGRLCPRSRRARAHHGATGRGCPRSPGPSPSRHGGFCRLLHRRLRAAGACGAGRRSASPAWPSSAPSRSRTPRPTWSAARPPSPRRAPEERARLFDGMAQTLLGATARERRPEIVAELRARMTLTPRRW